ncbi:sugar phosphate isomerase/epimerase family protein [Nitrospinota bacterium]
MTLSPSVSAHLFAHEPLTFDHLKAVAEAGYRQVELWAMKPNLEFEDEAMLSRLRGWLEDLSLEPASFHAPFYGHLSEARAGTWLSLAHSEPEKRLKAINAVQSALVAMANLGARFAVIHPAAPGSAGVGDTADGLRQSLERLIPLAEHLDLTLALENIPAPLGRAEPVAAMIERIDHPRVRVCLDSGHANLTEGENSGEAFRRLAPLAAATHLHDNDGERDEHLIPGEGKTPFPALWNALHDADYEGPLTFELRRREEGSYADLLTDLGRATPLPSADPETRP